MQHTMTLRRRLLGVLGRHRRVPILAEQQWHRRYDFPSAATAVLSLNNRVSLATSATTPTSTSGHREAKKLIHKHVPLTNAEATPTVPITSTASKPSTHRPQPYQHTQQPLSTNKDESEYVLPFSVMPTAKGIPILGTLPERLWAGGPSYLHRYIDARHRELGDVFKIRLDGIDIVFAANPEAARQVFANEGSTPWHYVPSSWELYNQTHGVTRGIFFMYGDEWLANRRLLNPPLLRPAAVAHQVPVLIGVARDTLSDMMSDEKCFSGVNKADNVLKPITNLEKRLYRWALESLCVQMFGHRCGFLIGVHDEFLDALEIISVESSRLQNTISPAVAKRYNLPVWSRLANANTIALEKARDLVEQELSIAQDRISTGLVESTAIVDNLIISKDLNHETIVRHIIDLLMAAADTTAHTLAWCLYLVGQHKDAQQKARKELLAATGNEVANLSASSLAAVPYIKGMLKEGIRMYPVATFILRALSQETVLGGYHTPAGTVVSLSVYSTGRDSRFFSDAENFIPERWLRHQSSAALTCPKQSTGKHHSHAFLPFGIGARSCIGRRLAETQLQVFLAQLLATCQVSTLQPTHMKMRMVSIPADPIQIAIQQYND